MKPQSMPLFNKNIFCLCLFPISAFGINFTPQTAESGDSLTISGNGFSGLPSEVTVYVGPIEASVTSTSSTEIQVNLPNALSGGIISVLSDNGLIQLSTTAFQPKLNIAGTLTSKSFANPEPWTPPWEDPPEGPFSFNLSVADDDGSPGPSQGVIAADLNRDGKVDLAVLNWNRGKLILYQNTHSSGELNENSFNRIASYAAGTRPVCSAIGDLNGDGWLDIVVADWNDRTITFLENTTADSSSPPALTNRGSLSINFPVNEESNILVSDFDNDGFLDVIAGGANISLIRATSASTALDPNNYAVTELVSYSEYSATMIAVTDLDGDNFPDIIAGSGGSNVGVFLNSTSGGIPSLEPVVSLNSNLSSTRAVYAADINSDGKPDILTGSLVVFENTTDHNGLSFAAPVDVSSNASSLKIGATDLSGDGLPDIWVADRYDGVLVFQNRGTGTISERFNGSVALGIQSGDAATGSWPQTQFADLNGDSRQDLIGDGLWNEIVVSQNSAVPVELVCLDVRPSATNLTVPWYKGRKFSAYGIYSDGSEIDLTESSVWSRTNTEISSGEDNIVIAEEPGAFSIRADYDDFNDTSTISTTMIPSGNSLGYPDVNFAPKFAGGAVKSIAVQSDGSIIVGGSFDSVNGVAAQGVAKILTNGEVDLQFISNLGTIVDSYWGGVKIVEIDMSGRIIIAGGILSVDGHDSIGVARLLPDGSVDTSFVSAFTSAGLTQVGALCLADDSQMYVGGKLLTLGLEPSAQLVLLGSDGTLDTTFSPLRLYSGEVRALGADPQGRVYAGGSFYDPDGLGLFALVRLTHEGDIDSSFDTTVITNVVNGLKVQPNGKIACVGSKSGEFVIRLNSDGSKDDTFLTTDHPFWGVTEAVTVDSQNRILVPYRFAVNRLNTDGTLDSEFQTNVHSDFAVIDMELTPWGDLWIAGGNSAVNGLGTAGICRIHLGSNTYNEWLSRQYTYSDRFTLDLSPTQIPNGSQVSLLYHYAFGDGVGNIPTNPLSVGPGKQTLRFSYDENITDLNYEVFSSQTLSPNSWERIAFKDSAGAWIIEVEDFDFQIEGTGIRIEPVGTDMDTLFFRTSATLNPTEMD